MIQDGGLLAHCTANSLQKEVVATNALHYVLQHSPAAREALGELLAEAFSMIGDNLSEPLAIQNQWVAANQSRPDLTVIDAHGERRVLLELKFFAELTAHQPLGYLKSLPHTGPGLVLFIGPASYLPSLWHTVRQACLASTPGSLTTVPLPTGSDYFEIARFTGYHLVGALNWQALLNRLDQHMTNQPTGALPSDLLQLRRFVERIEAMPAWLPLQEDDLSAHHGLRLVQYRTLLDAAVTQACQTGNVHDAKPPVPGIGWYGRYVTLGRVECLVHFSAHHWSRCQGSNQDPLHNVTPLWCGVYSPDLAFLHRVRQALQSLPGHDDSRFHEVDGGLVIALTLLLHVGEDQVRADLVRQLCEIADVLAAI
jgi:hypothetical protein